jgi:hypothetical protein
MKRLGKLTISPEKIMKNEELINLQGGYGYEPGTCAWQGGSGYSGICDVSRYTAEYWSNTYGGNWCCDSCHEASWYNCV